MSLRRTVVVGFVLVMAGFALAGASCETTGQGSTPGFPPRNSTPGN